MLPEKQEGFLNRLLARRAGDVHALHYLHAPGYGYHCLDLDLRESDPATLNARVDAYFRSVTRDTILATPAPERFWRLMASKSGPDSTSVKRLDWIYNLRLPNTNRPRTAICVLNLNPQEAAGFYS